MKVSHHTNGRFCFGKGLAEIYFRKPKRDVPVLFHIARRFLTQGTFPCGTIRSEGFFGVSAVKIIQ